LYRSDATNGLSELSAGTAPGPSPDSSPHLYCLTFIAPPFIAPPSSLYTHRSPFIAPLSSLPLHRPSSLPLHRSPFHRPIFIQRRASTQPARWANGSRRAEVCRMRRLTGPAGQRAQRRARAVGDATTGACRALHARCDGTTSLGVGGGSSALALAGMPGQIRVVRMSCLPVSAYDETVSHMLVSPSTACRACSLIIG
jgi:hypothetical protein